MLKNKTIIVGICGGIAAYKSCELVSRLKSLGADVWVVMTKSAQKFVAPLTFRALSQNPVVLDLFSEELASTPVPHISLSQKADLIIIAPATANIIGKISQGIADDPLSTIVMSSKCKRLIAPAMNPNMWENPIVEENSKKLKSLGYEFIGPESGKLACGDIGLGRMSKPGDIIDKSLEILSIKQDLKGKTLLITAGGTREAIDPVRYIGNRSSGKMGFALAEAAVNRGAKVILISGKTNIAIPEQATFISAETSGQMHDEVMKHKNEADVIIMAAAVSDFTPAKVSKKKIKKGKKEINLKLKRTVDILSELGRSKNGTFLVGFALESEDLMKNAKKKLREKNLDMIIANDASAFDCDQSQITMIHKNGKTEPLKKDSKTNNAQVILDRVFASQ